MGAETRGIDDLRASLDSAARALATDLPPVEVGQQLVSRGAAAAPRETGTLANSHQLVITAGRLTVIAAAPHAAIVHAKQPWLDETLTAETDQIIDAAAEKVAVAVAQIQGA